MDEVYAIMQEQLSVKLFVINNLTQKPWTTDFLGLKQKTIRFSYIYWYKYKIAYSQFQYP